MYHIKPDKRSQTSARMITSALEVCLTEKEYEDITVTDIQQESGVSRATFYRLFDRMDDVVAYLCDCTYETILQKIQAQGGYESFHSLVLPILASWMKQKALVSLIISIHREDILYQTHLKWIDHAAASIRDPEIRDRFSFAHVSLISSILSGMLAMWVKDGAKKTPEEMADILQVTFSDVHRIMYG